MQGCFRLLKVCLCRVSSDRGGWQQFWLDFCCRPLLALSSGVASGNPVPRRLKLRQCRPCCQLLGRRCILWAGWNLPVGFLLYPESGNDWVTVRELHVSEGQDVAAGQLLVTLDEKKSDDLWRKWGDMAFDRQVNMPLFWLPAEIIVDPNIVRDYVFPGSISGTYTHFEYIKANPK